MDFSRDGDSSNAQVVIGYWHKGFFVSGADQVVMNILLDKERLDHSFTVRVTSGAGIEGQTILSAEDFTDAGGGLARASCAIGFAPLSNSARLQDLVIYFIGNHTTYAGNIYLETLSLWKTGAPDRQAATSFDKAYVNATILPIDFEERTIQENSLLTRNARGEQVKTELSGSIRLVDPDADAITRKTYLYLESVGKSDNLIFGQEENTWSKAGSPVLSPADTMDLTGSYSGIVGLDTMTLVSQYSVPLHNRRFHTEYMDIPRHRVKACADVCNWSIEQGAIISLSTHMPNFTKISESEDPTKAYAGYDFTPGTTYDMEGDPARSILPGGSCNQIYRTYLDMIADFAGQVEGTILFRPLPENPGDWIWWGTAGCDANTYQQIYRYTVEYLRDMKRIHNMLYVYSPSGDIKDTGAYEARYPGDAYADIVGFNLYQTDHAVGWMDKLQNTVKIVDAFAEDHHKLMAVTEIGPASTDAFTGSNSTALPLTGKDYSGWYKDVLDIVSDSHSSYMMTWKNQFREGFYTPFAVSRNSDGTILGHELADEFIQFFNDPRTIFACNQKRIFEKGIPDVQAYAAVAPDSKVITKASPELIRRYVRNLKEGNTVTLSPAKGANAEAPGSELTVRAADMSLLANAGAALRVEGPVAAMTLSAEGVQFLAWKKENITFTAERGKNTVDVSVQAGDSRLTYVPGGIQADIYMEDASSATVKLVSNQVDFPYGDPAEVLLGMAASSLSDSGRYTASVEFKNGKADAWFLADKDGNTLASGTGLDRGIMTLNSGKTLNWTLNAGNILNWEITEKGKTIMTGSAPMGISGRSQALFDASSDTPADGRYTAVIEVKDGNVVKWSYQEPDGRTSQSGSGFRASVQIDPQEPDCKPVSTEHGSALRVTLTGSAKLKLTDSSSSSSADSN